jgi:hypothetical protein
MLQEFGVILDQAQFFNFLVLCLGTDFYIYNKIIKKYNGISLNI